MAASFMMSVPVVVLFLVLQNTSYAPSPKARSNTRRQVSWPMWSSEDLVKTYGAVYAVNDVSLTVEDGEFVALVGPSGCGKTTTLNLVAGLIPITVGEIAIGDRVVNDLDPRTGTSPWCSRTTRSIRNKTVYKNLAFPLQMRKLPTRRDRPEGAGKRRACSTSTHLLERKPRELSGGQQQRVALGRALVRDPAVFLMDEPLSNLDAKLRVQMRSEIKRFHQDLKATIIYVTHDQLEAVTMADKMAVMNGGFLQQYDTPGAGLRPSGQHVRRQLHRQPGDEPHPARGVDGRRPNRADRRGRLDHAALADCNARKVAERDDQEGRARRAPLDDQAAQVAGRRARSRPRSTRSSPPATSPSCRRSCPAAIVNISVPPTVAVAPDEQVWLEFDQERMHLFDGETELAAARLIMRRRRLQKITAIKPYPVWVGIRNQLLVKVETDQGVYGWGESGLSSARRRWSAPSSTTASS